MRIGVDLDQILADIMTPLLVFHNTKYGTKLTLAENTDYNISALWGISEEQAIERIFEFYFSQEMEKIVPVIGSQKGIKTLINDHELILVTSRPHVIEHKTKSWLDRYFPNIFKQIIHTNQMSKKGSKKRLKSEICRETGVEIMIDDALSFATDISGCGIPVLLLDWPWNQTKHLPSNIARVHTWSDIVAHIDKVAIKNR